MAGVIVAGMMGWIANLGGQIRHSEIRANGGAAIEGGARVSESPAERPDRDD